VISEEWVCPVLATLCCLIEQLEAALWPPCNVLALLLGWRFVSVDGNRRLRFGYWHRREMSDRKGRTGAVLHPESSREEPQSGPARRGRATCVCNCILRVWFYIWGCPACYNSPPLRS
jgi:hypothetical protein